MKPITYSIGKGAKLFAVSTNTFKTNFLGMALLSDFTPVENLKYALLPSLMGDTNQNYPTKGDFMAHLEEFYGMNFFGSWTSYQKRLTTLFGAEFLDNRTLPDNTDTLGEAIKLLHDGFFHPVLDEDGCISKTLFTRLMEERAISRKRRMTNPSSRAFHNFRVQMLGDVEETVALGESEEFWESITREELTSLWQRAKKHPMCFFYVGCENPEEIKNRIEKEFQEDLPQAEAEFIPNNMAITRARDLRVEEEYVCQQGQLFLGYTTGLERSRSRENVALRIANEILGGSDGKLYRNVREKNHLCYSCYSNYSFDNGIISLSAGIDSAKREKAEQEMKKQVEALQKGDFTDEELDNAKLISANIFLTVEDSPSNLYAFYFDRQIRHEDTTPEERFETYMSITREEVIAVANRMKLDTTYFQKAVQEEDHANS